MTWHDAWKEFRDVSGLDGLADVFESGGFEFVSYRQLTLKGRPAEILRVSDGLSRYGIGTSGEAFAVCRFSKSGAVPIRMLVPEPNESTWQTIVRSIWLSDKLN